MFSSCESANIGDNMGSVMSLNGAKDEKTKEERVRDFVKSLTAIEQAIEPF